MEKFKVEKSIEISAPREQVWEILMAPEMFAVWAADFSQGAAMSGDWRPGGKVYYSDKGGWGLKAHVLEFEPPRLFSVEYEGEMKNLELDPDLPGSREWKGCRETYELSAEGKVTRFALSAEVPTRAFYEEFNEKWDRVLLKIKQLAEQASEVPLKAG